ncbi:MAG TPA: hypothetical protein VNL13_04185 [Sulfolobales archaeon]|nr:hypothetical protein [Sulfolobales archaeon]
MGFEDDEYIDVHEGGELSWMQRISNMVKSYNHRIEAHGDAARIVAGGSLLDIGPMGNKICLQAHLELPIGSDAGIQIDELVERVESIYRALYTIKGPFTYVLDDSLSELGLVHIVKCYEKPEDLEKDLEEILKSLSPQ